MIKWLFQYGAVIFLFNTILLSIEITRSFGNWIFLVLMLVYSIILLMNPQKIKNVLFHKSFSFLLILGTQLHLNLGIAEANVQYILL